MQEKNIIIITQDANKRVEKKMNKKKRKKRKS